MRPAAALLGLILALSCAGASAQSDEEQARAELDTLRREIARVNRELTSARARRNTLQQQLAEVEVRLGQLQRDAAQNRRDIDAAAEQLTRLEARRGALQAERDRQQQAVVAELRAAWQMGRETQLKVLLSQQNPHTVSRMLAYYGYFLDARSELLDHYRLTLAELAETGEAIHATERRLQAQREALESRRQALAAARSTREQAVASLTADIREHGGRLQQLEKDREKLEELLRAIEEAVVNLQVPEDYQAFADARGAMPWPVPGKRANRFGRARNEGKMRWQGVMIPAAAGTTVRAIHHGRVVYSDWFRGSGLLLIIDHGDGYMSLYAHNESLLREVGEWVTAGTPVGTVGSSGGRDRPGLYFEVRKDGKPVDPARWCQSGQG